MSYIIGNKCISECDTACVKVCPVDCINGPITIDGLGKEVKTMGKDGIFGLQLYINPGECIDCGACEPECPVDAIFTSEKLAIKDEGVEVVERNYKFYNMEYEKI
jgi:ferredoxin